MRILHLSDIHLDKKLLKISERLINRMLERVEEIVKDKPIDFIVISGDLVDKGGGSFSDISEGFQCFEGFVIHKLLDFTEGGRSSILLVPGNHDCDGKRIDQESDASISIKSSADSSWFIQRKIKANHADGHKALERIEAFRQYAETFGPQEASHKQTEALSRHFKFDIEGFRIGVSCLNTVWRCNAEGVGNPFILGVEQINECRDFFKDCDFKIAIMHNQPESLSDWEKNDVKSLIHECYQLLLMGHTHQPQFEIIEDDKGKTAHVTASGVMQVNAGDKHTYQNGFNVIDIEIDTGKITLHKYTQQTNEEFILDPTFGEGGRCVKYFNDMRRILKLKDSLLRHQNHRHPLIGCAKIDHIIANIKNDKILNLRIYGLSGLGKTKIVYEAFKDRAGLYCPDNVYYCENSEFTSEVRFQIELFFRQNREGQFVLVLDNCDDKTFEFAIKHRNEYNPTCRLIGLSNDIYNTGLYADCSIVLSPSDMKDAVADYVDSHISEAGYGLTTRDTIKRFAEGFPFMAIKMVEKANRGNNVTIHDADDLIGALLDEDLKSNSEVSEFMKVLSLFQPFPTFGEEYKLIFRNDCFSSPLSKLSGNDLIRLKHKVLGKYKDSIIEITDGGWNVRPFPLAVYLARKWFDENDDPDLFKALVKYVDAMPDPPKKLIVDCMCKRIGYMDESPSAVQLVNSLNGHDGLFRSENVVFSELGSRLILAMSTVNPRAVNENLAEVFKAKSPSWLNDNMTAPVRNNILSALKNSLMDAESYESAITVLGKLALEETDREFGNDSIGTFRDSFHILLSGTSASLAQRSLLIEKIAHDDHELHSLVPDALAGALAYGNYMRIGGNNYGTKTIKDYQPSNQEVLEYWKTCSDVALFLVSNDEFKKETGAIIKNNMLRWSATGIVKNFLPLIEEYGKTCGKTAGIHAREWYHFLVNVEKTSSAEVIEKIKELQGLYIGSDFAAELAMATQKFHADTRLSQSGYWKKAKEYFEDLAREFVARKIYSDNEELSLLLEEDDGYSMYFSPALAELIDDTQLEILLENLKTLIVQNEDNGSKPFVVYLISRIAGRQPTLAFMEWLKSTKRFELYTKMMARSETENLTHFHQMLPMFKDTPQETAFLSTYLDNVTLYFSSAPALVSELGELFDNNSLPVMEFILRQHWLVSDKYRELIPAIKSMMSRFPVENAFPSMQYDFWAYAQNLLEDEKDEAFAKQMFEKITDSLHAFDGSQSRDYLLDIIIRDYPGEIRDQLMQTLFQKDPTFFMLVSNHIGSGFTFGEGSLFQINEDELFTLLDKYPDTAPSRIAQMCPVFDNNVDNVRFSKWIIRLLDKYGDREDVLSSLDSNMNTYQWSGSVIPLLQKRIEAFVQLQQHPKPKVREWAVKQICSLTKELERNRKYEDFERLHYS